MLTSTFIHVPGVGAKTEARIWEQGICSWDDFLGSSKTPVSPEIHRRTCQYLTLSQQALERRDAWFFAKTMPREEWWRLYPEFREETVFLDIETTGLSSFYNEVTLVGLFNGEGPKVYVRGFNLPEFRSEITRFPIVVTFNGSLFDLPFLQSEFGDLELPPIHIDLRFLLKRLGFSGGLKLAEQQLGISRHADITQIDGFEATRLWYRFVHGDRRALELLIDYNCADAANLEVLLGTCYRMMGERLPVRQLRFEDTWSLLPHRANIPKGFGKRFCASDTMNRFSFKPSACERLKYTCMSQLTEVATRGDRTPTVLGLDLRASPTRPTGWAVLKGSTARTGMLRTDDELLELAVETAPDLISIDSPLSLPKGRDCTQDSCQCRRLGITRECERTLRKRAINVFPCLLPSMQGLTQRGIRLANRFQDRGFAVIESYPGAAQDILGIPRKKASIEELRKGLVCFGVKGGFEESKVSHDELDAITSALVGYYYMSDDYEALGNPDEGYLVVPGGNGHGISGHNGKEA